MYELKSPAMHYCYCQDKNMAMLIRKALERMKHTSVQIYEMEQTLSPSMPKNKAGEKRS